MIGGSSDRLCETESPFTVGKISATHLEPGTSRSTDQPLSYRDSSKGKHAATFYGHHAKIEMTTIVSSLNTLSVAHIVDVLISEMRIRAGSLFKKIFFSCYTALEYSVETRGVLLVSILVFMLIQPNV